MDKENEPQIDESLLTPKQKEELHRPLFSWKGAIALGILLLLIVACILVIVLI